MLISLGMDTLRQIASSVNLPPGRDSNKGHLVKALLDAPAVTRGLLLEHLSVSDLKRVRTLCGMPDKTPHSRCSRATSQGDGPAPITTPPKQMPSKQRASGRMSGTPTVEASGDSSAADLSTCFVAIDFETADSRRDSACAVALVRVEDETIVDKTTFLIRPPRRNFVFSYLHGITWADVAHAPSFAELWPQISGKLQGAGFLAAHNAAFDRSVLRACCRAAALDPPSIPFRCTVQAARRTWKIYPTKLPDVCAFLNLPLQHHDAASDAEACARIMIAARKAGFR